MEPEHPVRALGNKYREHFPGLVGNGPVPPTNSQIRRGLLGPLNEKVRELIPALAVDMGLEAADLNRRFSGVSVVPTVALSCLTESHDDWSTFEIEVPSVLPLTYHAMAKVFASLAVSLGYRPETPRMDVAFHVDGRFDALRKVSSIQYVRSREQYRESP